MSRPFKFKKFTIKQEANPQKVGTDSMLLGAWTKGNYNRILDIGTGTGILALMMAQNHPNAQITAIEPDAASLLEAKNNFSHSPFQSRILAMETRLQSFGSLEKFDLIISNPPYFDKAFLSADSDRNRARHTIDLPVFELYESVVELLSENGVFSIIIPYDEEENHLMRAELEDLFPLKIMRTCKPDGSFKRSLIQYSFLQKELVFSELFVKDANNKYSDVYIALTKDYYLKDLANK